MEWGNVVSWLIILIGWLVVNYQHNSRETRKEIRVGLLELYKILDDIEAKAFDYHTSGGSSSAARRIRAELAQLHARIKLILCGHVRCDYVRSLAQFRKSITYENFDTANYVKRPPDDDLFDRILEAKRDLIVILEQAFNNKYRARSSG
jgi:hypothetical protein